MTTMTITMIVIETLHHIIQITTTVIITITTITITKVFTINFFN